MSDKAFMYFFFGAMLVAAGWCAWLIYLGYLLFRFLIFG
jgi:hypothetical protein